MNFLTTLFLFAALAHSNTRLANIPCEKEVLRTLSNLEAPLNWIDLPVEFDDGVELRVFKSKSTSPKVNLELAILPKKTRIIRSSLDAKIEYSFDHDRKCNAKVSTRPQERSNQNSFSDFDFHAVRLSALKEKKKVVFYAWSPKMALSMKGLSEIYEKSLKDKFKLVAVLDPTAPLEEARRFLIKAKLPMEFLKSMDSDVLFSRKMNLHYPSLLVWKNEKMGALRPGYDEPARLRGVIL